MYILVSVDVQLETQNIQMKLRKKEEEEYVRKLSTLVNNLQKILVITDSFIRFSTEFYSCFGLLMVRNPQLYIMNFQY